MARQRYARLRVDAAEGTLGAKAKREDLACGELAARYLAHQRPLWRPKTHYAISSVVGLLVKEFGELRISQIEQATVEGYKRDRLQAGRKASTVLKDLTSFQAIFHWAVEQGITTVNPVAAVKFPRENARHIRFLTDEEEARLLMACNATLRPVVQLALHTGLRKKELLGLQWGDVDFDRQVVTVREVHAKSGLPREVPLNRVAWGVLTGLRPKDTSQGAAVFLNRLGKPYAQIDTLYRAAVAKAGVKNFRFHDLRHTFASRLVMRGVSLAAVRELLGHQDYAMTLRYAHLADEHKRDAVEVLSRDFPNRALKTDGTTGTLHTLCWASGASTPPMCMASRWRVGIISPRRCRTRRMPYCTPFYWGKISNIDGIDGLNGMVA